jgi:hypothetical protein
MRNSAATQMASCADNWFVSSLPRDTNNDGRFGRTSCENMPDNLKAGCYWRYNWAGSNFQGWNIAYKQVACPSRLTQISGCETKM